MRKTSGTGLSPNLDQLHAHTSAISPFFMALGVLRRLRA
jgi:hypothetical protein